MTEKISSKIVNLFIFSTVLGQKEGTEHEKILFYHPDLETTDNQSRHVGLSDAIIRFTGTFSPDRPCEVIRTQKTRQVFYQPEDNFWMVMTASVPYTKITNKDGTKIVYHADEVQDQALRSVLITSYKLYKLFNGFFVTTFDKSVSSCREQLKHFFQRFIEQTHVDQLDLQDIYQGIRFLPLSKHCFLKVQCFVNLIEGNFSQIQNSLFLFADQLIWSGLDLEYTQIMFTYLTTNLLASHGDVDNIKEQSIKESKLVMLNIDVQGKFVTGPADVNNAVAIGKVPRILICNNGKWEAYAVIVYKVIDAVLCMLVKYETIFPLNTSTVDFFRKLDKFIGPQITQLAFDIAEQNISNRRASLSEMQYKFIYFNRMNCAFKSSIYHKVGQPPLIGSDITRLFCNIHTDLDKTIEDGEIIIRTASDSWVVGKKADQRELFVFHSSKNATLLELTDDMKKLSCTQFNNIFLF